ncbi:hypothetical protein [Gynuella sunshinyii]|uniref:hypothetical protein n=1 Tax=Gynuella sunshinyii TaxID=1445505 RepID=UPI0005CC04B7|nr:hypothetical protein [Gynuella sunshinyii]
MSTIGKIFLLLETIVCFGPVFLLLMLGIIVWPLATIGLVIDGDFENVLGFLPVLLLVVGGALGMASLVAMLLRIISPETKLLSPFKIRIFMVFGVISILAYGYPIVQGKLGLHWAIIILPLLATTHIYWLGHSYLHGSTVNK